MASQYRIQRPYVLATLPRPLDHTDGRIQAREVYGQREGQRRKKRAELVVGIDGEAASIYDVGASRLITSYPIPPQESFTCPPYSVRVRNAGSSDVLRYTLIATRDSSSHKITLFKDVVHADGKTTSTTTSQTLTTSPVRYITCSAASSASVIGEVQVICENGEFLGLSGETLSVMWTTTTTSTVQDAVASKIEKLEVEYVTSVTASEAKEGMFKDRQEVFATLPANDNPDLLVMVVKTFNGPHASRSLVVMAASDGAQTSMGLQRLTLLTLGPLPHSRANNLSSRPAYQVDAQSGLLLQLQDGFMSSYDITEAVPKAKIVGRVGNVLSFIRMSRPFALACSTDSISLYNYQYQSVHSRAQLNLAELLGDGQQLQSCQLLSYLRSLESVVALIDNVLVSIQIEPPNTPGRRHREGFLVDSIGHAMQEIYPLERIKRKNSQEPSRIFSRLKAGTLTKKYHQKYMTEIQAADELLSSNEQKWELFMRKKLSMEPRNQPAEIKREEEALEGPEWHWAQDASSYPPVDRRWVLYAISRVFSVDKLDSDEQKYKLRFMLPDSNVVTYLVLSGKLSLANVRAALRDEFEHEPMETLPLASDLVQCLADADPSMTLLLNWLQATEQGELEIVLTIRTLMRSMDLIPDTAKLNTTKLLTNEAESGEQNGEQYEMDLDKLEREIAATEHYLGDDAGTRSRGLTLAFTKLELRHPAQTILALRQAMQTEEILSFVYLLRVELVRGAWTSLYIDPTSFDSEGNDPPPDGIIGLIAELLSRCLDAVGTGGWLFNDAMSWADKDDAGDFITALKLEVMAALEGIQEATFLESQVSQMVQFGSATQKSTLQRFMFNPNKPMLLQAHGPESRLLPIGLKAKLMPGKTKHTSQGEVQRSVREMGHLISQQVEPYSLEKIVI
ncbi:hypothetical protein B0I35DRAFT_361065 [Stachybotrys elegans]|uniref:Utp8 beta-propeller domain-containing protein n=1 Tax=Stachybotrys elegans TaxID=80388 RepID=A0A8K0SLB6_9HYPO|nr:hypothetical protein B0I35DRAFT_361065 [Stachybotrys elegans]